MRKFILSAALALVLGLPGLGLGEVATPEAGTTVVTGKMVSNLGGKWSLRPSIQLSALRIDLRSGDFSGIVALAGGYGIEYDGVFSVDLTTGFKVSQDEAPNSFGAGVVLGFFDYFHVGVDMDFREHSQPQYGLVIGASLPLSIKPKAAK